LQNRTRHSITRGVVLLAALAFLYFLFAPLVDWVSQRAFPPPISCGSPYQLVAGSYQIEGTRQWEGGEVVLYRAQCVQEGHAPLPAEGAYLRGGRGLTTDEAYSNPTIGTPPDGQMISFSQSYGDWVNQDGQNSGFSLINGRIYAPNVTSIEATFANGQVGRDGTGAAIFAVIIPANVPACELRALDAEQKIVVRIDLSTTNGATAPKCELGRTTKLVPIS
jgi:hypothetical protein